MDELPTYCRAHDRASERRGIDAANHCWHRLGDGKDVCLGGVAGGWHKRRARGADRADNMSGPFSNAAENKVRQELMQKLLKRTRDAGERAAAPAADASGLMEMESLTQDPPG